ncbi:hypothetical protein NC653_030590 [Populus alba x Populus x berolinensis]|uniref:Reverse transcriptase domain-containing protein n=1 Tax=Populus alba x Populus x berolinensis TaxID=444605 RepID=A0AAD6LWC2_9ROSI|nr:hypothetical protein NC653_030590 [Populus alba x Populus x berolinensis]
MFVVGSWNIWGLNGLQKQKNVHAWAQKNNLDIFGLLETKIGPANLAATQTNLAPSHWQFHSNITTSSTCRILIGWNSKKIHLTCVHSAPQWLTCDIFQLNSTAPTRITFVYGFNTPAERLALWHYITQESSSGIPWIVMGDFNAILQAADRIGGDTRWPLHLDDFNTCIRQSELIHIPYTGLKYSWHNGQHGYHTIQKKLDWVFGNQCLLSKWPAAHATFQPRCLSDHSAMILHLCIPTSRRYVPFKFLNIWATRDDFMDVVGSSWQTLVSGNPMYQLTTKLRRLKSVFRTLHHQHTSDITGRVASAREDWFAAQHFLDEHPASMEAQQNERSLASRYMQLCKDEEAFFKQRSRIQWLQLGDKNTAFFHKSLLHRQTRNIIHMLQDELGNTITDEQEIGQLATTYYEQLLSATPSPLAEDITSLYSTNISDTARCMANLPITNDDIKNALFSIPDSKSPGPDGYNALFFKKSWPIIGVDFIAAVRYFFSHNSLPRCVNATRVTLVPKIENPSCLNDYRPISCCNVLYKCISKLIVHRLKVALADVIDPSQTTFLPGRHISNAILLTQELLHNYHLNTGPARCALKIDLKKAFDTVSWDFILSGLVAIDLPPTMINWITTCITTAHYSISINRESHGFFKASRGIWQGDPLSPYLFVLAMAGLGGIIKQAIQQSSTFKYHWRCKPTGITHVCFADDLMLFCHADLESIGVLKSSLDKFSMLSGLSINLAKSSMYLSGIDDTLKSNIQCQLGIQQQHLPVRYLGVPLISTRLTHTDCILLVYWSSIFILPCSTIKTIERILSAFLWTGTSLSASGAKVAWTSVCYLVQEGGLGIKRIADWNKAATLKHIWHLLTNTTSIWTTWVHVVLLRNRSFWHINTSNPSWSWRKILQSRDWCRGWFTTRIGNGSLTSLWYDYWLPQGKRLIDDFSLRNLTATGLPWTAKVSAIITNGQWQFLPSSSELQAIWDSIRFLPSSSSPDICIWKGHPSGEFSIASAWELIRDVRPVTSIHHLLWFRGHIPRHSFILWLACRGRLRTMDRLHSVGILTNNICILCGNHVESHEHLFFECTFSGTVWRAINTKAKLQWPCIPWQQLLQWAAMNCQQKNNISNLIARLLLSASVYILWNERNNRIFSNRYKTTQAIVEEIFQLLRTHITNMEHACRIPESICTVWSLQV